MDFAWTEEQLAFRKAVVDFAQKSLSGAVMEHDRDGCFSREDWNKCAQFGIQGLSFPEQYGGSAADILTTMLTMEGLGYGCRDNGLIFGINAHMTPNAAVHLGLALHELIVNSASFGAIAGGAASITLNCREAELNGRKAIEVTWAEALPNRTEVHEFSENSFGKTVLAKMLETGEDPARLVESMGMSQISDTGAIVAAIQEVLKHHPQQVAQYHAGQTKVTGYLVGQIMKATQGRAKPDLVNKLLTEELGKIQV